MKGPRLVVSLGAVLVAVVGCGSGGGHSDVAVAHTIESGLDVDIGAGDCIPVAPVSAPAFLPDGATNNYTVTDSDDTDSMTVGIIDDSLGCDFPDGYGVTSGTGSVINGTGPVIAGNYDFYVQCNNLLQDCIFTLDWDATY